MSNRVDLNLIRELEEFGLKDAGKCYNCGNCTAICDLSTPENPFPRKMVRYVQLGQKELILKSPEPWLCYYCGDCSIRCPREADPGETMMVLRRYLTSLYDWTGFSKRFYTSEKFEELAVGVIGGLVGLGMIIWAIANWSGINWAHADVSSVWSTEGIEKADLAMAGILSFFLLTNLYRCVKLVMGDYIKKVPLRMYWEEVKYLLVQFATQKQFDGCKTKGNRQRWIAHLAIMTGYASIFLLVVVFINGLPFMGIDVLKFQRGWASMGGRAEISIFNPLRLIGYYSFFAIMYGTTYVIISRLKKTQPQFKNTHSTDWMFLILLQATAITGIFINLGHIFDWVFFTYAIYVIHMMVAIPMLVLEVPFAKWAHLAYRPVVLMLMKVKGKFIAQQEQAKEAVLAPEVAV
ncbi:MAG: 4Fe-4S dicluster domain-containing protein [Syntrophobacteraceae bacterium]|nr:4Fe-4S dicluster domain-containing protein [Syntrophobacteraceae bacterium]